MINIKIEIQGERELQRTIRDIADARTRHRVSMVGAGDAARVVVKQMRAGLAGSKRTGLLRRAIGVKRTSFSRARNKNVATAVVGARRNVEGSYTSPRTGRSYRVKPFKYAHLLETGARPHTIRVRGRTVRHPGFPARRPLGRAVSSSGPAARSAMVNGFRKGLHREAARAARRSRG